MVPSKHWTSKDSAQTQVRGSPAVLRMGLKLGWRVTGCSPHLGLSSQSPPSSPTEDLVAQNIDVVLNRRNCMAATLRIIEENIPEVREPMSAMRVGVLGWGGTFGPCL